ncbi:hypothetical protein B1218_35950, partial [Pseudomonas ogarae]
RARRREARGSRGWVGRGDMGCGRDEVGAVDQGGLFQERDGAAGQVEVLGVVNGRDVSGCAADGGAVGQRRAGADAGQAVGGGAEYRGRGGRISWAAAQAKALVGVVAVLTGRGRAVVWGRGCAGRG